MRRISIPIRSDQFVQLVLLVVVFAFWSYGVNSGVSIREVLALTCVVLVSFFTGQACLASLQAGARIDRSFPMIWLTGLTMVGAWVTAVHIVTSVGLVNAFISIAILSLIGNIYYKRVISEWTIGRRSNLEGNLASVVSLIAATFWLQHSFPQKIVTDDAVHFGIFEQNFEHTVNMMALLTPTNPFLVGSIEFAGEPLSFYHWACYSPSALVHLLGGQPANDTMASFWYPLSMYIIGLSSYILGRTLYGSRTGLLATAGVVVLPDITYWTGGFIVFSFIRMIEVSAGMGYACGAAVLSVFLIIRGIRGRSLVPFIGILVAFGAGLFKVNIVAASLPASLFAFFIFSRRRQSAQAVGWIALLGALVGLAILAGLNLRSAPSFALDPQCGSEFVRFVLALVPLDSWTRVVLAPNDVQSVALLVWSRAVFVVLATFQGLIIVYGMLVLLDVIRNGHARRSDQWILVSVAFYALLAVCLIPNANGDPFELQHRDFCWYYILVTIGLAGFVARWLEWAFPKNGATYVYIFLVVALVFPFYTGRSMSIPSRDLTFARGFSDSIDYIRQHSNKNDVILDSERDPLLVSAALSERRSFIARERNYSYFPGSAALRSVREERWEETNRLFGLGSVEEIGNWSHVHKVRWVLLHPETEISWPARYLNHPAFQSREYRVYDLELAAKFEQ